MCTSSNAREAIFFNTFEPKRLQKKRKVEQQVKYTKLQLKNKCIEYMYFRVLKHFEHPTNNKKQLINMHGLLTKCELKMAGYWPSPFLRVYGPRLRLGP